MSDLGPCVICGRAGRHAHHITGRGADHQQLDSPLKVPLCNDDHDLIHDRLRDAEIDAPLDGADTVVEIERCLRRLGLFFGAVAEFVPGLGWLGLAAAACVRWSGKLAAFIARLDRRFPEWRKPEEPG